MRATSMVWLPKEDISKISGLSKVQFPPVFTSEALPGFGKCPLGIGLLDLPLDILSTHITHIDVNVPVYWGF